MPIESVAIRNFRGIKECSIGDFADVNVLIGRNGSGKSTILESIYLASAYVNPRDKFYDKEKRDLIISRRTDRGKWDSSKELIWFLTDTTKDIEINLTFTNKKRLRFKIIYLAPQGRYLWLLIPEEIRKADSLGEYDHYNLLGSYVLSRKTLKTEFIPRLEDKINEVYGDVFNFLRRIVLIDSKILSNPGRIEDTTWAEILTKRLDKLLIGMIREGFEAEAEDLTYMPVGRDKVLALKLPKTTVRVDDLGDGARTAILLASILLMLNDTAVLIEEPESHQHPGGLKTIMNFALKMAKERKLQLFMSTHSTELLKILRKLCEDVGLSLRIFFLERDSKGFVDVRVLERIDVDILLKLGLDPRFLDVV